MKSNYTDYTETTMIKTFQVGQNSLEVCKIIIGNHPEITSIKLISHKVQKNWRQVNDCPSAKLKNILKGFEHKKPIKEVCYTREKFFKLNLKTLQKNETNEVWSIVSKVICANGVSKHIPMMNFHPENAPLELLEKR